MTPCALLRQDTGATLVLDGVLSVTRQRDGALTRKALPDRSYVVDGITSYPAALSIEALIPVTPTIEGLTTGAARVAEVLNWLEEARRVGAVVAFQEPGRAQDHDLVVERYSDLSGADDAPRLTLMLAPARFADTSMVALAARPTRTPKTPASPSEGAKDGEAERDGGRRSLAATLIDGATSLAGGFAP